MLFPFLALIPQLVEESPYPALTDPILTHAAGYCFSLSGPLNASVTLSWTDTNYDDDLHVHKIYQDNVLIATVGAFSSYTKNLLGLVEDTFQGWPYFWTFRVDTVNKSNNLVLATVSYPQHVQLYGQCDTGQ